MKRFLTSYSSKPHASPSFALISVLALVSLAALTATAFLASARLERQATMPLTQTTTLDMALDVGANAASKLLDFAPGEQFNFVTTYWRGTNEADWTNELGYLLVGAVPETDDVNLTEIKYFFCFSGSQLTNLGTTAAATYNIQDSADSQATFKRQIGFNMRNNGTNFANGQSTNIPLLGDTPTSRFTSPPVGWVYIKQDVRVKPGQTNTTNVPVARFAFYVQDLSSMLDAERMGGETDRSTGTNPAEISLTNLTGTALTNVATASSFTSTNNRMIYLTPGMLVLSNGGGLNTNDLRYVTTGLRHWTNAYERIPLGLFYSNCGTTQAGKKKYCLEPVSSLTVADIRDHITSNCPPFAANGTNGRAGGMDGTAYVTALAANIIDYVDTDFTPTTTNINGVNIVGFDNYPMLTHVYDSFLYSSNARTITHTTWLQFWNPSTQTTPSNTITLNFTNNDIVKYLTNTIDTNSLFMTNRLYTNPLTTTNFVIPDISANAGYVTNFVRPTTSCNNFSNFPNPAPSNMYINMQLTTDANLPRSNSITNSFNYTIGTNTNSTITPAMKLYRLSRNVLNNNSVSFSPGFLAGNKYVAPPPATSGDRLPIHDPRMTPYLGQGSDNLYIDTAISTTYWRGYVSQSNANLIQFGDPAYWPDGSNTNLTTVQHGALRNGAPDLGLFTNAQPAPCKISNAGSYSNIVELGNIFDPIQWAPPNNITTTYLYSATNIASNWNTNNLFGGGSTLRIGRPEHPRFAWTTNLPEAKSSDPAAPNMQQSAAALLDLFCVSPNYSEAGKINLNTAPAPVLRALAGGILLANAGNHAVPSGMTEAFAQGIMRFRAQYPFYSPSQLAFINTSTNWSQGANGVARIWPSNAVFGNTNTIFLVTNSVNTLTNTSLGITGLNDQAAEEWFSKIFQLSTVSSRNFRVYVIAQKATTNSSGASIGVGPVVRKYYNLLMKQNGYEENDTPSASAQTTFQSYY